MTGFTTGFRGGRTAVLLAATLFVGCGESESYDILIRGGQLVDGTGAPVVEGDVGITDGRIAAIGDLSGATGLSEVDATGLYVTPGFIDVHSHAGPGLATEGLSHGEPLLAQGLTTVVVNPDGGGRTNLAEQREALEANGLGVNVAQLVPHGSVRREVMGMEDRGPSEAELDQMRELVRAGMEEGGWGLSSGTFYTPGSYSENSELIELSRVVAEYNGVYESHIRDESNYTIGVVAAVDEVIDVARQAGVTGIVTHIKALGPFVWGSSEEIIEHIDAARAEGVSVYADQYPYLASATGLSAALLPRWSQVGGRDSLMARMDDPATMARIRSDMEENLARRGGADRIQFRRFVEDPTIEGRLLSDLAEESGRPALDVAVELLRVGSPSIVSFNMDEEDLKRLMRQPWTMTSSDGSLVEFGVGVPHPRTYGAFPRKLQSYVFEESVVPLEQAIHSMTGLPAAVMGMEDRGTLVEGAVADVVVFGSDIRDNAEFTAPHQLSTGVRYVLVGGEVAVESGAFTGIRAGSVLQKQR